MKIYDNTFIKIFSKSDFLENSILSILIPEKLVILNIYIRLIVKIIMAFQHKMPGSNTFVPIFFFFFLFRATPAAYGSSQVRGRNGAAAAAGLCHSHSNDRLESRLTYTTAHSNARSFNPLSEARDQTHILMGISQGRNR